MSDARPDSVEIAQERRAARARRMRTPKDQRRVKVGQVTPPRTPDLSRTALPVHQPGAARFSEDAGRLSAIEITRIAKRCGLLDELLVQTDYAAADGRDRIAGHWVLAYLAFVQSGNVDVQPWLRETSAELWWECGFKGRPRYPTVYRRFLELEQRAPESFFDASRSLIGRAIERSGKRVAFDVAIDCSEADTNARLHHDCRPGDGCGGAKPAVYDRHGRRILDGRVERKASVDEAKARREEANAEEFDPDRNLNGDEQIVRDESDPHRIKVGGHWYRFLDPEAGVRAYTRGGTTIKFWAGYYNLKVTCTFFGLPVLSIVEAADEQEYHLFPEAINRLTDITGPNHTRAVITDRGFAIKDVFDDCHRRGITLIAPLRREKGDDDAGPQDREAFDRDGIPRCKFCGGETVLVRFARKPKPRLWFECARPINGVCTDDSGTARVQTLLCSTDSRYLQPLWRTTPAYQALLRTSFSFERAHHQQRQRNANGGNHYANTPKRTGRAWQQLRANASIMLDWLKLLDRMGWLDGSAPRLDLRKERNQPYALDGAAHVRRIVAERRVEHLDKPYGPAALKLGLGPLWPDERRKRSGRVRVRQADTDTHTDTGPAPATRPARRRGSKKQPAKATRRRWMLDELSADPGDTDSVDQMLDAIRRATAAEGDAGPPGDPPAPADGPPDGEFPF